MVRIAGGAGAHPILGGGNVGDGVEGFAHSFEQQCSMRQQRRSGWCRYPGVDDDDNDGNDDDDGKHGQ